MKSKSFKLLNTHFKHSPRRIFRPKEIFQFLTEQRNGWGLATLSNEDLLEILISQNLIVKAEFTSTKYDKIVRYLQGEQSIYELALSLQHDSFLSHGTALNIHGITVPLDVIYVNREQSPKDRAEGITQTGLKLAFRNKQRQTKYIFGHEGVKYALLSGKHTGRAGVTRIRIASGETLEVTDRERTLIDVVVRPAYAGGSKQIASAYTKWVNEIDVNYMMSLLQQFGHSYPYHQAIGFLMERAGRSEKDCQKLEALGMEYDFYLDYGMKRSIFNKRWRLYHPASLE